jgi:hypothetical protein
MSPASWTSTVIDAGTNDNTIEGWVFDNGAAKYVHITIPIPKSVVRTGFSFTFQPVWTAETLHATDRGVSWKIKAVAKGDGDAEDAAYGTEVEVADTQTAAYAHQVGAESGAVTPAGLSAGDLVQGDSLEIVLRRDPADADDTIPAGNVILKGVNLFVTSNTLTDA